MLSPEHGLCADNSPVATFAEHAHINGASTNGCTPRCVREAMLAVITKLESPCRLKASAEDESQEYLLLEIVSTHSTKFASRRSRRAS